MEQAISQETLHNYFQEIKDLYKETDRKFQDTDRKFQDTDRAIKELSKSIGHLGNRLGDFVEGMVRPSAVRLFQERGIEVHQVSSDVHVRRDGQEIQIDLLVVNDGDLIAVECKSALTVNDVNEHLSRLKKVKRMLPHYRDMRVMGAVAAMVLPSDTARYAYKKGLFVLSQSGEAMTLLNDEGFTPQEW